MNESQGLLEGASTQLMGQGWKKEEQVGYTCFQLFSTDLQIKSNGFIQSFTQVIDMLKSPFQDYFHHQHRRRQPWRLKVMQAHTFTHLKSHENICGLPHPHHALTVNLVQYKTCSGAYTQSYSNSRSSNSSSFSSSSSSSYNSSRATHFGNPS